MLDNSINQVLSYFQNTTYMIETISQYSFYASKQIILSKTT
jgi:hypothetical protein